MSGNVFQTLAEYVRFPFVQYALIAGALIALSAALLGVTLVLKHLSLIGDGLSHVAFGAYAIAGVLSLSNDMWIVMPATILFAVLLLRRNNHKSADAETNLAIISVGALAMGYLFINIFSQSANLTGDVCAILFGSTSILTLKPYEVWMCVGLTAVVAVLFVLLYNKIFAVTFDETFSVATGIPVDAYNMVIAVVTAVVIVLSKKLVGSLLTSALIIFPPISAMRVFKSYRQVVLCSAIVSVICAILGVLISIVVSTPVGCTVVAVNIAVFFIFQLAGRLRR